MRKTLLLFLFFCLFSAGARAGEPTTDHLTVSDLQVDGNDHFFVVSLSGSRIYTAYNMDIHLPQGITPLIDEGIVQVYLSDEDGMYPYTGRGNNRTYQHTIGATWEKAGERTLRVVCTGGATNAELKETAGELFTVFVNVSPYAKAGSNTVGIDKINLIEKEDARQWDPASEEHTFNVGSERSIKVNIAQANQWSTCVLPFASALPQGVQAYGCGETRGDYLVLSEAGQMEAYTPYILYAGQGYSGTLTGSADGTRYTEVAEAGYLRGAIVAQQVNEGYVLQNQGSGAKFYNVQGETFAIPEGRCWLTADGGQARAAYALAGGDAAAIGNVDAPTAHKAETVRDLQGRPVATPQPGRIYIVEGRKMLKIK